MANSYITIANSSGSLSKKFAVIQMKPPQRRTDTFDYTLGGKLDKQAGPVIKEWNYVLWVDIDTAHATGYGVWSDLNTLFSYTNPNGTPTDVITFTDHFSSSHYAYFAGEMLPEPVSTIIAGPTAWYMVPVTLVEKV